MPVCLARDSENYIQRSDIENCQYVALTLQEYNDFWVSYELTPESAGMSIGFGFSIVMGAYFSAYPVKIVKYLINLL
uniref:hypothetical protein n=1 Tax=Thaumasiovibrio subtropicus TaxID=1891207 RepID=UPI000B364204|nr:hypothetical protein [Thaumasiovibrio subtropicus]